MSKRTLHAHWTDHVTRPSHPGASAKKGFMRSTWPLLLLCCALALSGCAAVRPEAPSLFDLGAWRPATADKRLGGLPPIRVAEVAVPGWLDTPLMYFRLDYANQQQPRPYASSRWAMPPGQMLTQLTRLRIAQAGGIPLSASDGAFDAPLLRIHVDDFSQHFSAPDQSSARFALRATVFRGRAVVAQRSFALEQPASSPDAAGGAEALAAAADLAFDQMTAWLAGLNLK